jgi:hypothetical protein
VYKSTKYNINRALSSLEEPLCACSRHRRSTSRSLESKSAHVRESFQSSILESVFRPFSVVPYSAIFNLFIVSIKLMKISSFCHFYRLYSAKKPKYSRFFLLQGLLFGMTGKAVFGQPCFLMALVVDKSCQSENNSLLASESFHRAETTTGSSSRVESHNQGLCGKLMCVPRFQTTHMNKK